MFTIALVGRPNVGKSTLFNRLIGRRHALVDDTPGVTRDRREGEGRIADLHFQVVDTAGLEEADPESLAGRMRAQTERAIADADLVLMMVDARSGIMPLDEHFARLLRRRGDKVVLLANKSEGAAARAGLFEAFSLGLGEPVAISAEHNEGMADLYEAIRARMPEAPAEEKNENAVFEDGSPPEEGSRHLAGPGPAAGGPHGRGRPAECRQVDPGQRDPRRGSFVDRPGGRNHP